MRLSSKRTLGCFVSGNTMVLYRDASLWIVNQVVPCSKHGNQPALETCFALVVRINLDDGVDTLISITLAKEVVKQTVQWKGQEDDEDLYVVV